MYILTRKEDDVIFETSEDLATQEGTGYYLIKNGTLAVPPQLCKGVFEIEENDKVKECPEKWIYTEKGGLVKNTNYKRYYSNEERIQALEDMVNEIIMEM